MMLFSKGQLDAMRRVQRMTLRHRATFLRYDPQTDSCSGQHVNNPYPSMEIACGLDHATGGARASTLATEQPTIGGESSIVHFRTLRLPHEMGGQETAQQAVALSQYVVTHADGQPLARPLVLEQVGGAEAGPSGVVVKVREVLL